MRIVVLMTEDNIYSRGLVKRLLDENFKIEAIIVEKSRLADRTKSFLKSDYWNPPPISKEIPIHYTTNQNSKYCLDKLKLLSPDIILLGGGRILDKNIIDTAKIGVLLCHPGLLPDYRGMDIVAWSIYNGDNIGVSCFFLDEGVDTGPILMRRKSEWGYGDTLLKIRIRLQRLCIDTTIECLRGLISGTLEAKPQRREGKRYFSMPPEIKQIVEDKINK